MSDLLFAINIVMPMAILLAIGYLFKKIGFLDDHFLRIGKKLCFYVFLSCSLFKNLYDSSLESVPFRFLLLTVCGILIEILLSWIIANKIASKRNETGVIIQGSFRSNFAYLGIPLATTFFTDPALVQQTTTELSLTAAVVIPLYNIFSVLALTRYGNDKDDTSLLKRSVLGILKNPCIISVVCGIIVLLYRGMMPSASFFIRDQIPFLYKVLSYLAQVSTPFAFLLVGASLDFRHSVTNAGKLSIVVALRNLIFPAAVLCTACLLKAASAVEYAILVSVFASPTAVASAVMAAEMGGDSDLANEIVIYSTAFSMISLMIIIYTLKAMGCV